VSTVSNLAAFNDSQPSAIRVMPSRRKSFTSAARDIKTGGSDDGGTHLAPNNADKLLVLEEPCLVLVLWIWENGVYPHEPGSL